MQDKQKIDTTFSSRVMSYVPAYTNSSALHNVMAICVLASLAL